MKEPPPRHSQFSKFYMDNDDVDYNMKSPLGPIVGYPCRNFKAGPVQGTMVAGHPFRVQFDGVATHLGGDCQFAVSYDNGTTFAVIWDKISSCFLDTVNGSYNVPVPDTIPASKKAIFAWSWINALGSREFYMNCADVRIENYGHQEPLTAHELLVVNLPGKPTVPPKTGREEDRLISLFKQRSFVTVGKPTDLATEERGGDDNPKAHASNGDGDDTHQPGEPDPFANVDSSPSDGADSTLPNEITSFVFTTRTVTEDDDAVTSDPNLDAGFTYSELDDYKARSKPSNGLTVLSDDNEINEYLGGYTKHTTGADTPIPFNIDDTIPLATHHYTSSNDNFDLWPSSSESTITNMNIDGESTKSQQSIAMAMAEAPPVSLDAGMTTVRGAGIDLLNTPSPSSIFGEATATVPASPASGNGMVTMLKTVTLSSKLFLQVVVSSNNTAAIPSSLTISY
ncbi:hypothetical protein GGI26_001999 [Coemansia sp. RSA 1358]|nr:hypothetical protein EDC05_002381 [Coemansia umbellata]KAJ2623761.1 hypothetical protein GGI26_001999 [Coemansia sp. RSA 1358]